jgi:hypothetical protein
MGAYFDQEEPMTLMALLLPAFVGGLLLAGVLLRLNRRQSSGVVRRSALEPMSPDLINMAHIRVAGVGGLGMLGAAVVTAVSLPEIGVALVTGVGLGAAIAAGLIAYRRRSSAAGPGGPGRYVGQPPSVFALDERAARVAPRAKGELPGTPLAATA